MITNINSKISLNNFQLKIIACIFMALSHIQYYIGVNNLLYVGQAAFPIFAFLSCYAFDKVRDQFKYIRNLLVFGIIIQIPIFIMDPGYINIMITLGLGLVAIYFLNTRQYLYILPIFIFAYFTGLDYGVYGILLMLSFYIFKEKFLLLSLSLLILNIVFITYFNVFHIYQWFSILGLPFIYIYNGKLGKYKWKYFFYIFYPVHVVIINIIAMYI